jgi:archaemetzincin
VKLPPPASPAADALPLALIAIGPVDAALLERLGPEIDRRFGTASRPGGAWALRSAWYSAEMRGYDSDPILDAVIRSGDTGWSLGVTSADLFAPTRPWIFGVATQNGCCALVSTARLSATGDSELTFHRLLKEAVHELGHVCGLSHCSDPRCVMSPSTSIEAVDAKAADLCRRCLHRSEASGADRKP